MYRLDLTDDFIQVIDANDHCVLCADMQDEAITFLSRAILAFNIREELDRAAHVQPPTNPTFTGI